MRFRRAWAKGANLAPSRVVRAHVVTHSLVAAARTVIAINQTSPRMREKGGLQEAAFLLAPECWRGPPPLRIEETDHRSSVPKPAGKLDATRN